ncbi:unnamed protein product, partial [Trichobilharzia szidati]
QPLTDLLRGNNKAIELDTSARHAFTQVKKAIADATLLMYQDPTAPLSISVDASDTAIGAVLQQLVNNEWQPLAFFSRRLQVAETKYSTFGRELLAMYCAIRHFRHSVEGREFTIFTDHKPLTYSLNSTSDKYSPRESRQLDYVSQFSSDIRHVSGVNNTVADALSRICSFTQIDGIDLVKLARLQKEDIELQRATGTGQETNEARDPTNNIEEAMYRHPISIGRQTSRLSIKPLGRFFSPIREPSRFFYFRLVMS